jgi:peroxiredoxin
MDPQEPSDQMPSPGLPWRRYALAGGLLVATGLAAVLGWKHQKLGEDFQDLRRELQRRTLAPPAGAVVSVRSVATVDGDSLVLGDPEPGTADLLVFLPTTCPACEETLPAVRSLTERLGSASDVHVAGIFLDSASDVRAYREQHDLSIPAVSMLDRRTVSLFRVGIVPLAVVVGDEGRVVHARPGVMDAEAAVDSLIRVTRSYLERSGTPESPTTRLNPELGSHPLSSAGPRAGQSPSLHEELP